MNSALYDKIKQHYGHRLVSVSYADGENVAIECTRCNEVIVDANREEEQNENV